MSQKKSRRDLIQLSKFLSFLLRHGAEEFHLQLDAEGFASVESVWGIVKKRYRNRFDQSDLDAVIEGVTDKKKRLELVGDKVRALYGHSRVREIEYPAVEPPEFLYHGTNERVLDAIREGGLSSMQRQFVHLSISLDRAVTVAARRTKDPILLSIRAKEACDSGIIFHHPEDDHFLVSALPPEFIDFPS